MLAPRTCLSRCQAPDPRPTRVLVRLLGVRHMIEALAMARVTFPNASRWCGGIDAAHAATMAALAVRQSAYRRAAAVSLALSGGLAVSECRSASLTGAFRGSPTPARASPRPADESRLSSVRRPTGHRLSCRSSFIVCKTSLLTSPPENVTLVARKVQRLMAPHRGAACDKVGRRRRWRAPQP